MEDVLFKDKISDVQRLIDGCKKLVGYFKHSGLNKKLTFSLKQHVKTRWNSVYYMLHSVERMKTEIKTILNENDELERISNIDFSFLTTILKFLQLFTECSEFLSMESIPTINMYLLWYERLIKHCEADIIDSELMQELKLCAKRAIQKRLKPELVHYIALFLYPPFKELKFCTEDEKKMIYATIKSMAQDIPKETIVEIENEPSTSKNNPFYEYMDVYQTTSSQHNDIDQEIKNYLLKQIKAECDILKFWKEASDLPILKKIALIILCRPTSSATSERVFSTSGRILEERRSKLLGENVDMLLFLNKNI